MRTMIRQPDGNKQIDYVTPAELTEHGKQLMDRYEMMVREQLRGEKIMDFPTIYRTAASTGALLLGDNSNVTPGPESGFVWRIARLTVNSSGSDNYSANFLAAPSQPAVPASTVAQQNANAYPVNVVISGGTVTAVTVNGVQVGSGDGTYIVPSAGSIAVTYSVAPTWVWSNASTTGSAAPGAAVSLYKSSDGTAQQKRLIDSSLQVGVAYYPSSRGLFLKPGESLLASVAATSGNTYVLAGQIISVPAERAGRLA
jgi:hypothetical protein